MSMPLHISRQMSNRLDWHISVQTIDLIPLYLNNLNLVESMFDSIYKEIQMKLLILVINAFYPDMVKHAIRLSSEIMLNNCEFCLKGKQLYD